MEATTLTTKMRRTAAEPTVTRELEAGLWMLVPRKRLDADATIELRDACLDALDRGAVNLMIQLTDVEVVSEDALDLLDSIHFSLTARGGLLWIASQPEQMLSLAIARLDYRGLPAATGINTALDRAISARRRAA